MSQSQTQRSSRVDLLHGSILKSLLLFALPIMASRVFQQIYNTMDTLIVGHTLGDSSIAAMGACSSIYEMMTGFTFGVGNGLAIVTARCFGRQETDRMKKSVASCIVIGVAVTLVVTILATIFMHPLLRLRQGMPGRGAEFPHPLRRSPRTQLHPAQTTRNDLIIMVERLASPAAHELDALTDLWERSVRATHDFLAPEDIPFFRRMVRQEALPAAEIYVIRDSGNGFAAFAGIGADRLEMLFVAPSARGKGLGRELVEHVTVHCGVRRVDVNEQNAQAAGFYARMGFRIVSRDALDPSGRPYPILHLER